MFYIYIRWFFVVLLFLSAFLGTLIFLSEWEVHQRTWIYAVGTFALFVGVPLSCIGFGYSYVAEGLE
tara:strand:+ start:403 stop:603 length:201 start_codon:yes stop_codon:yes gene_type:complete